jgi:hypothetical protein
MYERGSLGKEESVVLLVEIIMIPFFAIPRTLVLDVSRVYDLQGSQDIHRTSKREPYVKLKFTESSAASCS